MPWQPRKYHEGGYLIVDHRASPGMSIVDARLAGFDPQSVAEGRVFESSTLTCSHCKNTVIKNPNRIRARERCEKCDHYVCDFCYMEMQQSDYKHTPFEAKIELTLKS